MSLNNLGSLGEKQAAKFLKKLGYKILDRNFQNSQGSRKGELDIIVLDKKNKEIVFVEVKARNQISSTEIIPEENITPTKLTKLQKISQIYLNQKKLTNYPYRFDAISIVFQSPEKKPFIRHIIGL
jgi:putative endonuclease